MHISKMVHQVYLSHLFLSASASSLKGNEAGPSSQKVDPQLCVVALTFTRTDGVGQRREPPFGMQIQGGLVIQLPGDAFPETP